MKMRKAALLALLLLMLIIGVSEGVSVGDSVVGMGTISVASLQLASSPMKRIAIKTQAHFLAPVGVIR